MRFLGIVFVSALRTIAFGIYSEAAMRNGPLARAAIPAANDRTPSHSTSSPAAYGNSIERWLGPRWIGSARMLQPKLNRREVSV